MFRRWMNKDPFLFWIVCAVVLVHGLGLGFLAWNFPCTPIKVSQNKQVVVKTVKLNPPPKKTVTEDKAVAEAPPPPPPQAKIPPSPKKTAPAKRKEEKPKTPPKQKPKEKPKTPPKQKPEEKPKTPKIDNKKKKLLQKAQEALAKIDQRTETVNSTPANIKKVPKRIEKLSFVGVKSSEKNESSSQSSYRSELALHLRAQLQLPEMGNVEVKLTISSEGGVENVAIVSSESGRNAEYITKTIRNLSLPPFGSNFGGAKSHTFQITLTNE